MKTDDIKVGRFYRGPQREVGTPYQYREVTFRNNESVWFRIPFNYQRGSVYTLALSTFARWAKQDATSEFRTAEGFKIDKHPTWESENDYLRSQARLTQSVASL